MIHKLIRYTELPALSNTDFFFFRQTRMKLHIKLKHLQEGCLCNKYTPEGLELEDYRHYITTGQVGLTFCCLSLPCSHGMTHVLQKAIQKEIGPCFPRHWTISDDYFDYSSIQNDKKDHFIIQTECKFYHHIYNMPWPISGSNCSIIGLTYYRR
jgi:hypothetical protein